MKSIPFIPRRGPQSYAQAIISKDETQTEVQKWIKSVLTEKDWQFQGIVFKDTLGNRWRFRSDKYTAVKSLRGNSPTTRERFAQLYTQNLVSKYLEYYKEDVMEFTVHLMFMDMLVKQLYDLYVALHITKAVTVENINKLYQPHLYAIHGIYLSQLKPNKKKVTIDEIKIYLHKLPWQRITFLIKKITETA